MSSIIISHHMLKLSVVSLLTPNYLCFYQIESFVKLYPGVSHGWTVRYNVDDEAAVKSAEEAHQDMLNWFTKHVK